jgi:hypothetical protein
MKFLKFNLDKILHKFPLFLKFFQIKYPNMKILTKEFEFPWNIPPYPNTVEGYIKEKHVNLIQTFTFYKYKKHRNVKTFMTKYSPKTTLARTFDY